MQKKNYVKRRDSKRRVLRRGESIRDDGLYQFKYHVNGKPKFVYSWRLEPTDKLPQGRKPCLSLREMEKQIGYDLDSQLDPTRKNMTVIELVERYIQTKTGVRPNTRNNYQFVVNILKKEDFSCFQAILEDREAPLVEKMVGGYTGFLYLDKTGMPEVAMHWEHRFNHMVKRYNEIYRVQMPPITPHVCRHTYCSNQAKAGMNPKTLQYLMGCCVPVARVQHRPSRQARTLGDRCHPEPLYPSGPGGRSCGDEPDAGDGSSQEGAGEAERHRGGEGKTEQEDVQSGLNRARAGLIA